MRAALFSLISAISLALSWPILAQTSSTAVHPSVAEPDNAKLSPNFKRFLSWFGGEFNNHEQVWQQLQDAGKTATGMPVEPFDRVHWMHVPMLPKNFETLGNPRWFYIKTLDAGDQITRQRLFRFSENSQGVIRLEQFSFVDAAKFASIESKPELAQNMILADLRASPGCEAMFRYVEAEKLYRGQTQQASCKSKSKSGKAAFVADQWVVRENGVDYNHNGKDAAGKQLFGRLDGKSYTPRRVNYFTGWAAIIRGAKTAQRTGKYSYLGNIVIHNEGDRYRLMLDANTPTGYSIELAQLTYQSTSVPVLKLALIDDETGETETYIWSNPEATRLGMNLKWIQVGLTYKALSPSFGYKDIPVAKAPMQ